jgi:hypothetical protein
MNWIIIIIIIIDDLTIEFLLGISEVYSVSIHMLRIEPSNFKKMMFWPFTSLCNVDAPYKPFMSNGRFRVISLSVGSMTELGWLIMYKWTSEWRTDVQENVRERSTEAMRIINTSQSKPMPSLWPDAWDVTASEIKVRHFSPLRQFAISCLA